MSPKYHIEGNFEIKEKRGGDDGFGFVLLIFISIAIIAAILYFLNYLLIWILLITSFVGIVISLVNIARNRYRPLQYLAMSLAVIAVVVLFFGVIKDYVPEFFTLRYAIPEIIASILVIASLFLLTSKSVKKLFRRDRGKY